MLNIDKNYSKKLTLLEKIFKLQCFMLKNLLVPYLRSLSLFQHITFLYILCVDFQAISYIMYI